MASTLYVRINSEVKKHCVAVASMAGLSLAATVEAMLAGPDHIYWLQVTRASRRMRKQTQTGQS